MSGITLAAAPDLGSDNKTPQHRPTATEDVIQSLRMIDFQLAAIITVFSASGLVPMFDLLFPALISAYLLLLSRVVFPEHRRSTASKDLSQTSKLFRVYVIVGSTVGLLLPLAYVLGGFVKGDDYAVRSATPHLFLLSFQVLTENGVSGLCLFSPPVRVLVPMLYTVRRIFVILDWVRDVWLNKTLPINAEIKDVAWYWFGRSLSLINLAYFSINLFGFLIPRFLPKAFERYFEERNEIQSKSAEDNTSIKHSKVMGRKVKP